MYGNHSFQSSFGKLNHDLSPVESIASKLSRMSLVFGNPVRDELLDSIYNHLVVGVNSKGEPLEYEEDVELASRAPLTGW